MSFAKNMGTHATKVTKNLSNKYGQKLIDSGNKIGDKITSVSKKSAKKLQNDESSNEIETPKKRYIYPEKRQQIIEELRLVPKKDAYF